MNTDEDIDEDGDDDDGGDDDVNEDNARGEERSSNRNDGISSSSSSKESSPNWKIKDSHKENLKSRTVNSTKSVSKKLPPTLKKKKNNDQDSHLCDYQPFKRQKDEIPLSSKDHLFQGRFISRITKNKPLQSIILGSKISAIALNPAQISRSYSTSALYDDRCIEESIFDQGLQRLSKNFEISNLLSNENSTKYFCGRKPQKYLSSKASFISRIKKNSQSTVGRHLSYIEPSHSELILIRKNGLHHTYSIYQLDKHSLNPIRIFPMHPHTPRRCACCTPKENQAFMTTDSLYPYCSYNHFADRSSGIQSGIYDTNQQSSTCRSFQQITTDNDDDDDAKSLISKISMKQDHRQQSKRPDQLHGDCDDETVNPTHEVITHQNKIIQTDSCLLQPAGYKQKGVQTDLIYCVRSAYGGAIKVYNNHPQNMNTKLEYCRQTSKKTLALLKKGNFRKRRTTTATTTTAATAKATERHRKLYKPVKYFSVSPMRKYYPLTAGKTKPYRMMNKFADK
ncbi:unnamed protein product [Trichobilharzia regenti]|nr:unnamed protein product [Trichobilharzia regenti]